MMTRDDKYQVLISFVILWFVMETANINPECYLLVKCLMLFDFTLIKTNHQFILNGYVSYHNTSYQVFRRYLIGISSE